MPPSELLLGGVLVVALVLYFLLGGADFGGGVWDLLATGPRRAAQRAAIERALGPVWEPNHVWLILVIVVLFTAFPRAFAVLATGLYVPLTLFLVGIVLRGSAFSFRAADHNDDEGQRRWGRLFAMASVIGPFLLGAMVATIASGSLGGNDHGVNVNGFGSPSTWAWLSPFSIACGLLALTLAAFLAATYLTVEVTEPELREDFRRRALLAGLGAGVVAGVAFFLARQAAPLIFAGLSARPYTWPLHLMTAVAALSALWALWRRRFSLARVLAAVQVALVISGWALSQYPFLVPPALTLTTDMAPARTRSLLLLILGAGVPILVPSLVVLYRVFKRTPPGPGAASLPER